MTIMQRPDILPAGPTTGRFFAVCAFGGFDIQSYPKFKHLVIRILLLKVNRWYGSIFEIQCGFVDNKFKLNYFDLCFTNYFFKKLIKGKLSKVFSFLCAPWVFLDLMCKQFVKHEIWHKLNMLIPHPTRRKKYNLHKKGL